jgi:hypothetical protein
MLSKTRSKVIARYITSSTMAIINVKYVSSGAWIRVIEAQRRDEDVSRSSLSKEASLRWRGAAA